MRKTIEEWEKKFSFSEKERAELVETLGNPFYTHIPDSIFDETIENFLNFEQKEKQMKHVTITEEHLSNLRDKITSLQDSLEEMRENLDVIYLDMVEMPTIAQPFKITLFGDQFKKLTLLGTIGELNGYRYTEDHLSDNETKKESLFLNQEGKIRPPLQYIDDNDTLEINSLKLVVSPSLTLTEENVELFLDWADE